MKLKKIIGNLATGILLLLVSKPVFAAQPQIEFFKLSNGIGVLSIHNADSKNVSIFSFLPMGLAGDGPKQVQWSHLIEHMVLRTPASLPFTQANAETLSDHIRLDFYGTVENWQEGLDHHSRWISGIPFTEKRLQAEKPRVNSECDVTAKRLFTHKFAIAAWAQGYRHNLNYVALKADINDATLSQIQQYRDNRLSVLDRTLVCIVGGVDSKTLKPVISEKFAKIKTHAKTPEPVKLYSGDRKLVWDLDARHLMMTWPIPNFDQNNYAKLMVAANWLQMKFFSDPDLKKMTGAVLAGVDLTIPEGNFFYISASVKPDASWDSVRERIILHVQTLCSNPAGLPEISAIAQQLSYQLTNVMDLAIAKPMAPPNISEAMIEANIALLFAMHEFRYGSQRKKIAKQLAMITPEQVSRATKYYLDNNKCSVCTLSFGQKSYRKRNKKNASQRPISN